MLSIQVQRRTSLLAVCTPVSESRAAIAAAAHAPVGYGAVVAAAGTSTTLAETFAPLAQSPITAPQAQVKGTNGSAIKLSVMNMDPNGGVRGIPPRGRPV